MKLSVIYALGLFASICDAKRARNLGWTSQLDAFEADILSTASFSIGLAGLRALEV